jgi:arylsulfatase A-like enzyme
MEHPRRAPLGPTILPIPVPERPPVLGLDSREVVVPAFDPMTYPPEGAPNIVVVVLDDVGFGAPSAFGGPCEMAVADRLAAGGLRYTRFHVTALCSPTRQALMTGRNHHAVSMGATTESATSAPGYTSVRPQSAATIAQVLNMNGYSTGAFGKWHQTPEWETGPVGPRDRWPTGEGFDKFYGFVGCEMNHWSPHLYDGTTPVERAPKEGYHLSEDVVDHAIDWMRLQQTTSPDTPFFLYLAFGACHAPLHVAPKWRDKYKGRFSHGWDRQRELTLERQKALGIVPDDAVLPPWPDDVPHWEELSHTERRVAEAFMETFAGFAEHTDAQVGRLVDAMTEAGVLDDTLVVYILGDNGGSGEGGMLGTLNAERGYNGITETAEFMAERLGDLGGPSTFPLHPVGWTLAMNTPYRWAKMVASHFGGTRNGMITHWPNGIERGGELRHQWHHVNDMFATVLDAAGIAPPVSVNGVQQQRIDGTSMVYSFNDPQAPDQHTTQYFEMMGNRGIYHDGWMAVAKHRAPWEPLNEDSSFRNDVWELYDLTTDWTQAHDLAARHPAKVRELQEIFFVEAGRNQVLPLDDRDVERVNPQLAGRPDVLRGRTSMTFRDGMTGFTGETAPNINDRSYAITAAVAILEGAAEGVIVHQGGRFSGWTFYCDGGRPTYVYNYYGLEEYVLAGEEPLTPGPHELRFEFDYDGGGVGKGGTGRLFVDGARVSEGRFARTAQYFFPLSETFDVGVDLGTPVTCYPWADTRFKSTLKWVRVDLERSDLSAEEVKGRARVALSSQ